MFNVNYFQSILVIMVFSILFLGSSVPQKLYQHSETKNTVQPAVMTMCITARDSLSHSV